VLARLRKDAGFSLADVVEATGIDRTTLYRIETGQARPQRRTLAALLDKYNVPDDDRDSLFELARRSAEQSWVQSFSTELSQSYRAYIEFEGEAEQILNYESLYIPGLFQTREYAAATIRAAVPTAIPADIERRTDARISRQAVLDRTPPLRVWVIIDEAALHRPAGGVTAMRAQLDHLVTQAELPHVTLQVIPFAVGPHPGMPGSFAVVRFGEPNAGDIVYVEGQASELFLESEDDVAEFGRIFEHLRALALPPAGSSELIARIAREQFAP